MNNSLRLIRKAYWVWRTQGLRTVTGMAARKLGRKLWVHSSYPYVYLKQISEIDPYDPASLPRPRNRPGTGSSWRLRWYMPQPGRGSGGHLNLFRIIDHLSKRGHTSEVAILSGVRTDVSKKEMESFIRSDFGANVRVVWDTDDMDDVDLVLATTWQSAYIAVRDTACAARAYVVQDWEPYFHARGSENLFAENSYRLGFHHITAGPWLAHRIEKLGATASPFPFAADPQTYYPEPGPRAEGKVHVVFYARPVTPRRCFELGVEALRLLNEQLGRGRLLVSMAGWEIGKWPADFAIKRHGILAPGPLRRLYSSADAVLVLSSTNPSLLPLEAALCGVPVVDLALPSAEGTLQDGVSARLAAPSPPAIAKAIADLVKHPDEARALAERARQHALTCTWDAAAAAVEAGLSRAMQQAAGREIAFPTTG